jgi:hypothetical protein
MKKENRELTLEELEIVCGGFNYTGFYRYRAEILNNFKIQDASLGSDTIYIHEHQNSLKGKKVN